jgi:hypothetical protein
MFPVALMAAEKLPSFGKYPVEISPAPMTTQLKKNSQFSRKFKTLLSQELKQGPNFAGKFRIVRIGCGSGCVGIAVLNCESGEAFDAKMTVDQSSEELFKLGENIEFKKDSRLLVLRGCINEDKNKCGVSQFEWRSDNFIKVSFEPI